MEATQRHKTHSGVLAEEKDKTRMDGENRAKKSWRINEHVWLEEKVKVQLTTGGLLQLTFTLVTVST